MGHGDTDTDLEKLKETLKDLVYSNKLIQVLIDPPLPHPPSTSIGNGYTYYQMN